MAIFFDRRRAGLQFGFARPYALVHAQLCSAVLGVREAAFQSNRRNAPSPRTRKLKHERNLQPFDRVSGFIRLLRRGSGIHVGRAAIFDDFRYEPCPCTNTTTRAGALLIASFEHLSCRGKKATRKRRSESGLNLQTSFFRRPSYLRAFPPAPRRSHVKKSPPNGVASRWTRHPQTVIG
jgi:hypothetical protein